MGSAWPGANFQLTDSKTEIAPGLYLIALVSDKPGTLGLRELSLAIRTPDGWALVVGCSHPAVDKIVQLRSALKKAFDDHYLYAGLGTTLTLSSTSRSLP
jgi:7,8-dihydropterin-6-yl-methyl-4-(beta-D-ribofuranosyl)aminobenzene 5'-phosphate synthase